MCFCLGGPDRLRFAAFVVGNAAPKSWKRVKVAIRFRLLSLLPSSPSKSTADAKGSEGGVKEKLRTSQGNWKSM